jgi:hypothetical protein
VNSRRKGVRGEVAAAKAWTEATGLEARRGQQYAGGPDSPDVVTDGAVHLEVKRCEHLSLYKAIEQARADAGCAQVPVLLHRKNGKPWLCVVELEQLPRLVMALLERESGAAR